MAILSQSVLLLDGVQENGEQLPLVLACVSAGVYTVLTSFDQTSNSRLFSDICVDRVIICIKGHLWTPLCVSVDVIAVIGHRGADVA